MPASEKQVQGYHRLYRAMARARRDLSACGHEIDAYVQRSMIEHDVPPGHAIDFHGDGEIKPKEKCVGNPDLG